MSIRKSMYRMVFLLTVLPFLLFSLIITQIYSVRMEKVITESLQVVAAAQVAKMTDFCRQQRDYLLMIGAMDVSHAAMEGQLDDEMLQYLNNMLYSRVQIMNYLKSFAIIDSDYRVAACSEEHNPFAHAGIEAIIESMGNREFYISGILVNDKNEKTLVAISRIEEDGQTLGYTLMEIDLDFYQNIREQAELWNEATFYLLDGNDQIISAGTREENRDSFITTRDEREDYDEKYNGIDYEKHPKGSFQYKIRGTEYITYYSNVEDTDWRFLLTVNLDNYQTNRFLYYTLAIFLIMLCILLAVWSSRFASKRIIHPVRHITETLREIQEKQDYSLRVGFQSKDEMGVLAEKIDELIQFIETEDLYKAQQQRILQEKAEQDALTKVLNKEWIGQYLRRAIDRHRSEKTKLAVLFVDVDDFKAFNTNYGHYVGDQVLIFLSSLLAQETCGRVGRVGGDEFLVILEDPQLVEDLEPCLERMKEACKTRFTVPDSSLHLPVSCCMGAVRLDFTISSLPDLTVQGLIDRADAAMYQVKKNGKHGYVIWEYA